jgi:ABC-2 type transport system ATP-binding protein
MQSVIVAQNLKKVYGNGVEAVKSLSLSINKGEVFGFLGPNGAGKSSSINMFTGIIRPTSGLLKILDIEIGNNNNRLNDLIGYVPQNLVFYDHLTVEENLRLFAKAYSIQNIENKITELLTLLKIDDLRKRRSENMSGGQKRRLNLAIGLLHTPKILFLDEPSAGMDPQSRNILWEIIEKLANQNGMTIILTTHLMETADRLSDRIAIIDDGIVQVVDTPRNLKQLYGQGDVIELSIVDTLEKNRFDDLCEKLKSKFGAQSLRISTSNISISTVNGVTILAEVMELVDLTIGKSNLNNISIRENSLEDVFIQITGRALRE